MAKWVRSIDVPSYLIGVFEDFTQAQADRLMQGHVRYGEPQRRKKYMSRMLKEVETYIKTGNQEQLYNIANYAILERLCPENRKAHMNPLAKSATRGKGF